MHECVSVFHVHNSHYHLHWKPWLSAPNLLASLTDTIIAVTSYNRLGLIPRFISPHFFQLHTASMELKSWGGASLVPRPHLRERGWHLADTSGFINVDYFLERNFSPPITLQKRQSVVQHRKFLATSAQGHSTFLVRKLVIDSQLCI